MSRLLTDEEVGRQLGDLPGWTREGDTSLSPGYARAARHVDVALASTMGGVRVEWIR